MSSRRFPRSLRRVILFTLTLILAWIGVGAILGYQPSTDTLAKAVSASDESAPLAPDFVLTTIDGERFRLSEHRGRVVVLNFWATWCPPCLYEIPDFIALQEEFGRDDVLFVGVSTEKNNEEGVAYFAQEMGINYPIMIDDGAADRSYGPIFSLPTTYLIDRAGRVQAHIPGMVSRQMLKPALEALVAEPA